MEMSPSYCHFEKKGHLASTKHAKKPSLMEVSGNKCQERQEVEFTEE